MIQVDELHIRILGNDKMDGAELGRQVAERLAAALPENYDNRQIPEIRLQLQRTASNDASSMADRIAEQIISQIKIDS